MAEEPDALVGNASDAKQVKEAKKKERRNEKQEGEDLHYLLSDARGRRVWKRYLDACGVFLSGFHSDAMTMAFKAGGREIGLMMMADLNRIDGAYDRMMQEARENG